MVENTYVDVKDNSNESALILVHTVLRGKAFAYVRLLSLT